MPASAVPLAVLIGCVSRKEPGARPAKDLYRTELFRRRRAHAEASDLPWFIVSAKHGLLDPDEVLEPYDLKLSDLKASERHELSKAFTDSLQERLGPLGGRTLEVHAGRGLQAASSARRDGCARFLRSMQRVLAPPPALR